MFNLRTIFLLFVLLIFVFSCRTKKQISEKATITKDLKFNKLIDSIKFYSPKYSTLTYRYDVSTSINQNQQNFNGILRIQKDSLIWMNALAMGFEGARIQFSRDSIKILNRLKSNYIISNFNYLEEKFNVDLNYLQIQSILCNSLFEYSTKLDNRNFEVLFENGNYILKTNPNTLDNDGIGQNITISPINYRPIFQQITNTALNQELTIEYTNFANFNSLLFPQKIILKISANGNTVLVNLDLSKVERDTKLQFPFKIPENYQVMRIN